MKFVAPVLLAICILLTILLFKEDRWVPGNYTGWGVPNMTGVITLLAFRWLVLSAAFIALVATGRLSNWAPWAILRVALVLGGVLLLEIAGFSMHSVFADEKVLPTYRTIFAVLSIALPVGVMAAGFFARRWLFVVGVSVAVVAGIWGSMGEEKSMKIKRPFLAPKDPNETISWLLPMANPMYQPDQLAEVFSRIEQRPDWIRETTGALDGPDHLSAMYVLCRQPARLEEALQEKCWTAAAAATVELDKEFARVGGVTTSEALKLSEALRGLSALPGPVRDRHRAEFLAAVDYLKRARTDSPQIPDVTGWDWVAK